MVSGKDGAANNYARGYYTIGAEIRDESLEAIRREVEKADRLLQVPDRTNIIVSASKSFDPRFCTP